MKPSAVALLCCAAVAAVVLWIEALTTRSDTLARIRTNGEIVFGYHPDRAPLSFETLAGKPAGLAIEVCLRVSEHIRQHLSMKHMATRFVRVSADGASALISGDIDISCNSVVASNDARVQAISPTLVRGGSLLSLTQHEIEGFADLTGRTVGFVQSGDTDSTLSDLVILSGAKVVTLPRIEDGIRSLDAGLVDAVASDRLILIGEVMNSRFPKRYSLSRDTARPRQLGLLVPANDAALQDVAHAAIEKLHAEGKYRGIHDRWLPQDR